MDGTRDGPTGEVCDTLVEALAKDLWQFVLDEKPELAVYRGLEHPRGVLDSFDLSMYARRKEFCVELLQRISYIEAQCDRMPGSECGKTMKNQSEKNFSNSLSNTMHNKDVIANGDSKIDAGNTFKEFQSVTQHFAQWANSRPDGLSHSKPDGLSRFKPDGLSHSKPGSLSNSTPSSPQSHMGHSAAVTLAVLRYYAESCLAGIDRECHLMHYNYWEGADVYFPKHTMDRLPFSTRGDYELYLQLLRAFPVQIQETIGLLRRGLETGVVSHRVSIVPHVIDRLAISSTCDPGASPFYRPFVSIPPHMDKAEAAELEALGRQHVEDYVQQSLVDLLSFINTEYVPHLREKPCIQFNQRNGYSGGGDGDNGCMRGPGGPGVYETLLRYYTSSDLSPMEVHDYGLTELQRINTRLTQVQEKLGLVGSLQDFKAHMQSQTHLYFTTKEELLLACHDIIFNLIRPRLQKLFIVPPDNFTLTVREHGQNTDAAKAIYNGPAVDGSAAAVVWISAGRPARFSRAELVTLMLHEAEPGHHLQACAAMRNTSLPMFRRVKDDRRYVEVPGCFPLNDAYTEGWGLYCEDLGYELGVYDDINAEFEYLCSDLARTVRLLTDTGIHALGWSREKAESFMTENSFLSATGVTQEINRYITWPGQACSYKIGQKKFKELRRLAETSLGERFDIKEFHEAVLACGQVPLSILEDIVKDYIHSAVGISSATY